MNQRKTFRKFIVAATGTLVLLSGCTASTTVRTTPAPATETAADSGRAMIRAAVSDDECRLSSDGVLELVSWTRICDLGVDPLTGDDGQYEASGIQYDDDDGFLYTVFDNSLRILKVQPDWTQASLSTVGQDTDSSDYEAITWDNKNTELLYVMVEMAENGDEEYGKVIPYDMSLTAGSGEWTDYVFETPNKGFEGAAWLYHCSSSDTNGDDYLLGLCEGNGCNNTKDDGNGRVVILRQKSRERGTIWEEIDDGKLRLPDTACFGDYADIALYPRFPEACDCNPGACFGCNDLCPGGTGTYTVAVVSQKSSALWLGTLDTTDWSFDEGQVYLFPETLDGDTIYGNVEGVTFLSAAPRAGVAYQIAVATDAHDSNPPCIDDLPPEPVSKDTSDQSLFIFDIPANN